MNPIRSFSAGASLLHPGGSLLSDLLIHSKSGLRVVGEAIVIGKDDTECRSIFDSLACPLGLMRLIRLQGLRVLFTEWTGGVTHHHWVRSVAQDACLTFIPMLVRLVYI